MLTIYGKKVEVYIYKDLRHDLLLGDDALRTLCANVDYGGKQVWLEGKAHTFQHAWDDCELAGTIVDDYRHWFSTAHQSEAL